jgi:putative nucleotidyltransferase with HDIG domain
MKTFKQVLTEAQNIDKAVEILRNTIKGTEWENRLFIAGGYPRDLLLGREPKDVDFVVDGGPEAGMDAATFIAKKLGVFKQDSNPVLFPTYGTAKLTMNVDGEPIDIEFVAPRTEKYEPGSRKPLVSPGTLDDDAHRRDFTVNALFKNLTTNEILDLTGRGLTDLKNKILQTTGNADWIFSEDPLRILRAVRFALKYDFRLPLDVIKAIKKASPDLANISAERIQDELKKILVLDKPSRAIRLFKMTGILKMILPELQELVGLKQNMYHKDDAFYHTLEVLDNTPAQFSRRLSALFHDIGKAATRTEKDGKVQFIGHANVGAEIAKKAMKRLKYPNDIIDMVADMTKYHMDLKSAGPEAELLKDSTLRKFVFRVADRLEPLLDVIHADNISHTPEYSMPKQIEIIRKKLANMDINSILNTKSILDGNEIKELGAVGKEIREIKDRILTKVLENPEFTRQQAVGLAKNMIDSFRKKKLSENTQEDDLWEVKRGALDKRDETYRLMVGLLGVQVDSQTRKVYSPPEYMIRRFKKKKITDTLYQTINSNGSEIYTIWNEKTDIPIAYLKLLKADLFGIPVKKVNIAFVHPRHQGKGIMKGIYTTLIQQQGMTFITGDYQSAGAEKLWKSLYNTNEIEVFAMSEDGKILEVRPTANGLEGINGEDLFDYNRDSYKDNYTLVATINKEKFSEGLNEDIFSFHEYDDWGFIKPDGSLLSAVSTPAVRKFVDRKNSKNFFVPRFGAMHYDVLGKFYSSFDLKKKQEHNFFEAFKEGWVRYIINDNELFLHLKPGSIVPENVLKGIRQMIYPFSVVNFDFQKNLRTTKKTTIERANLNKIKNVISNHPDAAEAPKRKSLKEADAHPKHREWGWILPNGQILSNKSTPEVIEFIEGTPDLVHHFEVLQEFTNFDRMSDVLEEGGVRFIVEGNTAFLDIYPPAIEPRFIYTKATFLINWVFVKKVIIGFNDYSDYSQEGWMEFNSTPKSLLNDLKEIKAKYNEEE